MPHHDTVERLAGGIAHDFDRLLAAIIGHADSLSDFLSPGDPRAAQVTAIRHAAEQAASLTQQLLAFSRTQPLKPTIVDVNVAIARARHGLQRVLGDRIALDIRPGRSVWPVLADAEQLDRVLHHLALSRRAALADGGRVVVSTANVRIPKSESGDDRGAGPGRYVAVAMTDTGARIKTAVQRRMFEPFFAAPERPTPGGLGLAMVYGAVKQSGGHVRVESPFGADGRGSRFTVLLPAARPRPSATAPSSGETVMLVGVDPHVQAFIADVLRRRGYRLLEASDAWNALQLAEAEESPIHLVIATGADGIVVAAAIRERHPSVRLLRVSASTDDGLDDLVEGGCDGGAVLTQPFTPAALTRKVRAILVD